MTSRNLPNVNIEVPDQQRLINNREMVSSARNTRIIKNRPPTSNRSNQMPIKHEPCSSTLGKFHDAVNFSIVLDNNNNNHQQNTSRKEEPTHPIMEAKNKYKYMVRQKSFIDESLFGNTSARRPSSAAASNPFRDHLSHDLMSNLAPLIVNPPIKTRINSARSDISNMNNDNNNLSKPNHNNNEVKKTITAIKPWRP